MTYKFSKMIKACFWVLVLFVCKVQAQGIPTTDDFADGADDKGGVETLWWLIETFTQLLIVGIANSFGVVLAKGAIKKYNDISDERGTWMDLLGHIVGGIALLTLTIIMLNWVGSWVE